LQGDKYVQKPNEREAAQVAHAERLLRAREVYEERLHLSRSTFYNLVREGKFPRPVQITAQRVGWFERSVQAWILSRPTVSKEVDA
jgi:prophage regulatory protein